MAAGKELQQQEGDEEEGEKLAAEEKYCVFVVQLQLQYENTSKFGNNAALRQYLFNHDISIQQ